MRGSPHFTAGPTRQTHRLSASKNRFERTEHPPRPGLSLGPRSLAWRRGVLNLCTLEACPAEPMRRMGVRASTQPRLPWQVRWPRARKRAGHPQEATAPQTPCPWRCSPVDCMSGQRMVAAYATWWPRANPRPPCGCFSVLHQRERCASAIVASRHATQLFSTDPRSSRASAVPPIAAAGPYISALTPPSCILISATRRAAWSL